jgi:hypothetical protein
LVARSHQRNRKKIEKFSLERTCIMLIKLK